MLRDTRDTQGHFFHNFSFIFLVIANYKKKYP
jgi:hypothetical protein